MFQDLSHADDITSSVSFKDMTMVNSGINRTALFRDNKSKLASWSKGCGKIACTGHTNILLSDRDGSFTGTVSQLLPDNAAVVNDSCIKNSSINGYVCDGSSYSVLRFASMAWDRRQKMNIPVKIKRENFSNALNMLWEWNWLPDGDPSDTRL